MSKMCGDIDVLIDMVFCYVLVNDIEMFYFLSSVCIVFKFFFWLFIYRICKLLKVVFLVLMKVV